MNDKLREALFSGEYPCPDCGKLMVFETEDKDSLVCEECGYDCKLDDYGLDEEEIFERQFPNTGAIEPYEEIYDEDD